MQFSNLFTALALAMTATALPAAENVDVLVERTDAPATCNSASANVCCPGGLLGGILCAVSVIGGSCNGQSYCCNVDAPVGSVINIQLLPCLKLN